MMDHRKVSTSIDLARVWVHETRRVFADRLISYEDKQWFEELTRNKGQEALDLDWNKIVGPPGSRRNFIMYADFLVPGAEPKVNFRVFAFSGFRVFGFAFSGFRRNASVSRGR